MGLILGLVAGLLVGWALWTRTRMVRLRQAIDRHWADIAAQLERRWALIPELIDAVRRYEPERNGLYCRVASARDASMAANTLPDVASAERALNDALFPLFALTLENRHLDASAELNRIRSEFERAQDVIERSTYQYNGVVYDLNRAVTHLPRSLIAGLLNLRPCDYFAPLGEGPDVDRRGVRA